MLTECEYTNLRHYLNYRKVKVRHFNNSIDNPKNKELN